jgi:hypothetical protein
MMVNLADGAPPTRPQLEEIGTRRKSARSRWTSGRRAEPDVPVVHWD